MGLNLLLFGLPIFMHRMRQNSGFSKFIHMVKNQSIGARMNYPGSLSFTHIDNLITLLIHVSRDESTVDEIFFADSKPILYTELFKILGEILGIEIKSIKLPIILYKSISWSLIHLHKIPYVKKKSHFICCRSSRKILDVLTSTKST